MAEADVDRLSELTAGATDDVPDSAAEEKIETSADIQEHMNLYEPIKRGLHLISENVTQINKLKQDERQTAMEKTRKEIMSKLDAIMSETTATGAQIKKSLDEIKKLNQAYAKQYKDSAKAQLRQNLYQTNIRKFHQVMNEYNSVSYEFKQALQERTRRQLKIVDSKITDEDVERIVESGKANDVIRQALVSDNLQNVVKDIEERHLDILKLEKQVLEVYELFRDLANLVDLQQEQLDVIELRIQKAQQYTKQGEKELIEAEVYQNKSRKMKCCLLIIVLGVLIAVIVPTVVVATKDS